MRRSTIGGALALFLFVASTALAEAPYPPSLVLADVSLDWSTHRRYAVGSDNWQLTWADDDHQYGAWGDGGGFGGDNSVGRVGLGFGRIEGTWDNYKGYNVWGGKDAENPAQFTGKSWGTICVSGVLYSWVVPDRPEPGGPRDHYRYVELVKSTDHAAHWTKADWRWKREDNLIVPTFLVCGEDNAGARDDYVYSYFIRPQDTTVTQAQFGLAVHKPGALFLARVPKDKVFAGPDAYEWFRGISGGKPTWGSLAAKRPVFENREGTGWCVSACYHPGLRRYFLATEHGVSHSSVMSLFDAPEPWGPWTTVKYWTANDRFGESRPQPSAVPGGAARIIPGKEWRAVEMTSPWPRKGSALDMSRFVGDVPAGTHGRVIRTPDGHVAFERRPGERVLFFGCSISPELAFGRQTLATKAQIETCAEHIRLQGYNLVRPHFLDHALTRDVKDDLEFNPDVLDRFDYFVKCLKDRGIYLYLDAMTSWKGYTKVPAWTPAAGAVDLKSRMYADPAAREHWEAGVRKLLGHRNSYTGSRLVDDPIVAVLLCFNEQEINGWSAIPTILERPWREYLQRKYATIEALKTAWRDDRGRPLADAASVDAVPLFTRTSLWEKNSRGLDAESFITEIESGIVQWYTGRLRDMGYAGLISHFDYLKNLRHAVPRNLTDVVSMHGYQDHPTNFISPGSKLLQTSSLADSVKWFRGMASTRLSDRPFFITEYGHVFWNRYRYEEGLAVGGYSALQDYDGLMAHAEPVLVAPGAIRPFGVGRDPVGRASQVVSGFLFARRDVTPARRHVNLEIRPEELFTPAAVHDVVSGEQSGLSLVTGFGVSYTGNKPPSGIQPRRADAALRIGGGRQVLAGGADSSLVDRPGGAFSAMEFLKGLKARKILPADNRTDAARGLYESENGQILLDARARRMTVRTPRLEGVSFEHLTEPLSLGALTVVSSTVPACVAAIALDDARLSESKRVLLVYATDALNSGMTFDDAGRQVLRQLGNAPVLMRTGALEVRLTAENAIAKAWALGLDGTRKAALPVRVRQGSLHIAIDTATLPDGPTPFFEIAGD